jgi:hypothetical protein
MDDNKPEVSARYVDGLAPGEVIQFGTGDWREGSFKGVAVSEAAFDRLEPAIRETIPEWRDGDRYGVTAIPRSSLEALIGAFGALAYEDEASMTMIGQVTDWLSSASKRGELVSIVGI